MEKRAVFGLGNPGRFDGTRHNIGKETAELLLSGFKKKLRGKFCDIYARDEKIIVFSRIFMNDSGAAFAEVCKSVGVNAENILVICDDFNLPLGRIRYRRTGSDGGHNGLKSIIEACGPNFPRIRIGIDAPGKTNPSDYVLGFWEEEKIDKVEVVKRKAAEIVGKLWNSAWPKENFTVDV